MNEKKCNIGWWLIGALGAGILLSIAVYAIVNGCGTNRSEDPRTKSVNELLKEAEQLIKIGKRGENYLKRTRG